MNLLSTAILAAEEGAASDHSNPLVPEVNELIWGAIAFTILFVILSKVAFPRILKTFEERTANIEGKLERAERERAEAAALLDQYRQKLDEAHEESARILEQARSNADRLEAELRSKAEEQARRIIERAQETIEGERDRALSSLRAEVGTIAIDLASKVVADSLDDERHRRLVDQYINELQSR